MSGWFECNSPIYGTVVSINRKNKDFNNFQELMVFSEYFVQ